MIPLLLALTAHAATPPSTTLTGPKGTLAWTVSLSESGLSIAGKSPSWSVTHEATTALAPVSSTRHADGKRWSVVYDATGATIHNPDGSTTRVDHANLWDGDTLDVRLGAHVAGGGGTTRFTVLDPAGGKSWTVNATVDPEGECAVPCTHVRVQLAGAWRYVGPTWQYWYDENGGLLTFDGPIGHFSTDGGAK